MLSYIKRWSSYRYYDGLKRKRRYSDISAPPTLKEVNRDLKVPWNIGVVEFFSEDRKKRRLAAEKNAQQELAKRMQEYKDRATAYEKKNAEYNFIDSIVLNGYRVFLDRSRGKHINDCIISVDFSKKDFGELYLRNADGEAVVRRISKNVPSDFTTEPIHIKPIYDSGILNVYYVR